MHMFLDLLKFEGSNLEPIFGEAYFIFAVMPLDDLEELGSI